MTYRAAADVARPNASPTHVDHAERPASSPSSGTLEATLPAVAFGMADAAPAVLSRGKTYPLTVVVWVASNSGSADVRVTSSGGRLTDCQPTTVHDAGVYRLHCNLTSIPGAATIVEVVVSAVLTDGTSFSRAYHHRLA
jgi:hypothetical protein